MSKLDIMIEKKENEVKYRAERLAMNIEALNDKKKTNGYFFDKNGANVNIFAQRESVVIFEIIKTLVVQKEVHEKAVAAAAGFLPEHLVEFKIENPRRTSVSFADAIEDLRLALQIVQLKNQEKQLTKALYALAKNYSDEKKKEIEVNELFDQIDKI